MFKVLAFPLLVSIALSLPGCVGVSSDLSLAKSTFEALCRGDRSAEEGIDFEVFSSFGTDVGETYRPFSEVARESFRGAFISQFAISFQEEGASADRFTNWRVENEDSDRMVVACDAPSGAVLMITVSKRDGRRKISSMAFQ